MIPEQIVITPVVETITFTDSGEVLTLVEERIEIISVGVMGPPGPAGASGNDPWHEDTFTLSGDQTVFVLTEVPHAGTVQMFVNGLYQSSLNFSVLTDTVTMSGFIPTTDDDVMFIYQAEV